MNGVVVSLWRYPVKSMLGEELNGSHITERGLLGDRGAGLVDITSGNVVSVKLPRKWARMFEFSAAFTKPPRLGADMPPIRITFPNGTLALSTDSDVDECLSAALNRRVRLTASPPPDARLEKYWPDDIDLAPASFLAPDLVVSDELGETLTRQQVAMAAPGTFFDFSPIHFLTTATLDRLGQLELSSRFDARRFRPNLVVRLNGTSDGDAAPFQESNWVGRTLQIGREVRLTVLLPTPRCAVPTVAQADLPADTGILRTIAAHNRVEIADLGGSFACVGAYARVDAPGFIRTGDEVTILPSAA